MMRRASVRVETARGALLALALLALLGLLLDGLAAWLQLHAAPWPIDALWLAGWLLLLVGLAWLGLQGVARSQLASLLWAALLLWSLASLGLAAWPWAKERWLQERGAVTPLKPADAGRTLAWHGNLQRGDAERLRALLAQQPQLRRIDLRGEGGSLGEAQAMAAVMRAQRLDSRVSGRCAGPCVQLFLAGARRQLQPEGEIAFQQLQAPSLNPLIWRWSAREQQRLWRATGLSEDFVRRALLTRAPRLWSAQRIDLEAQGALVAPAFVLDVPLQPEAEPDELLQALRSHPTWMLLEAKHPGTLLEAVQRLQPLLAHEPDAQRALHGLALQRQRELLAGASVEMRDRFLDLLAAQLRALRDPADCRALLAGDLDVRRRLPAELQREERVWLEDATVEPPPQRSPRHVVALDREVLQRTLGRAGVAQIDRLWTVNPRVSPLDCAPALALLGEIRALPPAQRKPAQRRLFD